MSQREPELQESARERLLAEALRAIRGSDSWPDVSAPELGGTSSGRYKSEIARVALESGVTELWRCPVDHCEWPTTAPLTGWGCPHCGAWMEKVVTDA